MRYSPKPTPQSVRYGIGSSPEQGPTFLNPGPCLPMFGDVEEFAHSAETQFSNWEELVSAGWEYARQFSIDDNGEEDEHGLGADIQYLIGIADGCWRRGWIEAHFRFHPTIQKHSELRSWCQSQFEALRVFGELWRELPAETSGDKLGWYYSLKTKELLSLCIPHLDLRCQDTIRLALPALYELDLPATKTDALVRSLEDPHWRAATGGRLTWPEWIRHVQNFRQKSRECPSTCHKQRLTFEELMESAWEYMRKLPGRFRPKEPRLAISIGEARRQLDKVIAWCDQEESRMTGKSKLSDGDVCKEVVTKVQITKIPGKVMDASNLFFIRGKRASQDDPTAYRPAKEFMNGNYKAISKVLVEYPWIRRHKPSKQRLLIHAGDWQEYVNKKQSAGDPLDQPAEVVDAAVAEVERRKAEELKRKERNRKAGS